MAIQTKYVVHSPVFPTYKDAKALINIWRDSTTKSDTLELVNSLWAQTGTPQNPVDWSNPDQWIESRLSGGSRELAKKVWTESGKAINPRYVYGSYLFINLYELLKADASGIYRVTELGGRFLNDDALTIRQIDEAEGLPKLLSILATHSPAKRGNLLDEWGAFLRAHSKYQTPSTIKQTLRHRLLNLVERGYITRDGNTYAITSTGVGYAADPTAPEVQEPYHQAIAAVKAYNDAQIVALRARLGEMDPYLFESLIKDLLEAMDYEDVVVTKQSGDKGVDVIANYEFGITQIREVVQVKRHQGSITRPILDQLRGALPYHQAIRGTIITLGKFAQGCKDAALFPGAAPITLIDGDKLIELMLKHEIGIKKSPQTLLEVDESYFEPDELPSEKNE
jgi:restriction system protein